MRNGKLIGLAAALALALAVAAGAEAPRLINYQGRLADSGGAPITGTVDLTFTYYGSAAAGPVYLTVVQTGVLAQDGIFNVLIGSGQIIPGADTGLASMFERRSPVFMGLSVNGDPEMTPRQRVTSVPYALGVSPSFLDRFINTADFDGDGYDKLLQGGGDCDDGDAGVNPGAAEVPCDGQDQDCDGADRCFILVSASDYVGGNFIFSGPLLPGGFPAGGLDSTDLGSDPHLDPIIPTRQNQGGIGPHVVRREGWSAVGLGTIARLDPAAGFTVQSAFPVNNGVDPANPQDMLTLSPTKAYITRFEPAYSDVLIVNPQTGNSLGRIDLTGQGTNPDGLPRLTKMIQVGGQVFVLMQNFSLVWPFTYGNGRIAVLDPNTDTLTTIIDLQTINPNSIAYRADVNKLIVASVGDWNDPALSGIETVDVATLASDTVIVRGNNPAIAGFITDVAYLGGDRAAILNSRSDWSGNEVLPVNLATRAVQPTVYTSPYLADIEPDAFGRLLIADNTASSAVILETATFTEVDSVLLPTPPQSLINWY